MRLEGQCCCGQGFAVEAEHEDVCTRLYDMWAESHQRCLDAFFEDCREIDEAMRERYGGVKLDS